MIVVGQVYTSEYDDREGVRRVFDRGAGHRSGTGSRPQHVRLERLRRPTDEQAVDASDEVADSPDDDVADPDSDEPVDGLPLTA